MSDRMKTYKNYRPYCPILLFILPKSAFYTIERLDNYATIPYNKIRQILYPVLYSKHNMTAIAEIAYQRL
jgi:hypothetical protein